ncbi:MAG: hypothetical protein A2Y98_01670 [Candidatus Portnoybacteria bacterium RBG_19FT_COMBO_36_7]|uniref:Uncharacterized protein n=1 Tax=Candidatus Portnoybacteria bacterium RBG_19FT_COMBO_36_7 TaxID=1801992 RepID=A0A1G2F770_9BACT|nr:MAG: hypothetical protein A2Y98_01670 [Candidatus Portnoybacteria bacterium RBG_19FT_COMBO_36_7]
MFLVAVTAVYRTIRCRLEGQFRYFSSAIRTGPVALEHLPLKTSARTGAAVISSRSFAKFIEGQIFSPRFPD